MTLLLVQFLQLPLTCPLEQEELSSLPHTPFLRISKVKPHARLPSDLLFQRHRAVETIARLCHPARHHIVLCNRKTNTTDEIPVRSSPVALHFQGLNSEQARSLQALHFSTPLKRGPGGNVCYSVIVSPKLAGSFGKNLAQMKQHLQGCCGRYAEY